LALQVREPAIVVAPLDSEDDVADPIDIAGGSIAVLAGRRKGLSTFSHPCKWRSASWSL